MRPLDNRTPRGSLAVVAVLLLWCSCGGTSAPDGIDLSKPVNVDLDGPMPERLSSFNFFAWDAPTGMPTFNAEVVPYDLNTPLFSDYAVKYRAIYVPAGSGGAAFKAAGALDFPVGSVVLKSFAFPADLRAPTEDVQIVETRLLVRYADGWQAFPYIWNEDQTDAVLSPAGAVRGIDMVDATGTGVTANYLIPQKNQCANCHARKPDGASSPVMTLLGPSARQLDRTYDYGGSHGVENQLVRLADAGILTDLPALDTITPTFDFRPIEAGGVAAVAPDQLDRAARDYLDANCAHCHNPSGVQGISSQLFLNHDNTDPFHLGICKQPGSAGLGTGGFKYDIVPGNPDASVLSFRITTTAPGAIMPLLGRSLVHARGTELIRAWIEAMPATDPPQCGLP
jgi:uncharacterized repeat protein (TIGR03806 family)